MNKHLSTKRKTINSMYYDQSAMDFIETLHITNKTFISDIFPTVVKRRKLKNYVKLQEDLAKNGMRDPIIIIENTEKNWERAILGVKKEYINNASRQAMVFLALTGNQRLQFAADWKYDTIDAFLVTTFADMHAIQLLLQDGVVEHES